MFAKIVGVAFPCLNQGQLKTKKYGAVLKSSTQSLKTAWSVAKISRLSYANHQRFDMRELSSIHKFPTFGPWASFVETASR